MTKDELIKAMRELKPRWEALPPKMIEAKQFGKIYFGMIPKLEAEYETFHRLELIELENQLYQLPKLFDDFENQWREELLMEISSFLHRISREKYSWEDEHYPFRTQAKYFLERIQGKR